MEKFETRAVISGIGQSELTRHPERTPLALALDACLRAIEDAGLTRDDIDGLATYPGAGSMSPGFSAAGVSEVQDALRLRLNWFSGGPETPGQLGSVVEACLALAAGLATHVLCFRAVGEVSAQKGRGRAETMRALAGGGQRVPAGSFSEWTAPFGGVSPVNLFAMFTQRYLNEYGMTREQLAQIALNDRKHAASNPAAVYREPLSLDQYLAARMISSPLCLYDCDVPIDGATAIVLSRADRAQDLRRTPIRIEAVGTAQHGRAIWEQVEDLTVSSAMDAGTMLWGRTDLRPGDVDVAELYDGFSFEQITWLEGLRFCGHGEAGSFIEGGSRIDLGGKLPVNTHGGQLSEGRTHGYGFLHEACVQLRGEGGPRQVPGAEVAIASAGGGAFCGCFLLTAGR